MAEIVIELSLTRDPRYLYYVRAGHVYRILRGPGGNAPPEQVATIGHAEEPGYLYFLDGDGHVARVPRAAP